MEQAFKEGEAAGLSFQECYSKLLTKAKQVEKTRTPRIQGVRIRGTTYPDVKTAAKALGLSVTSIYRAVKFDNLDQVGFTSATPVKIRGIEYRSISVAAKALSVTRETITRALDEGRIDEIGLPRGVTVNGKYYKTRNLARFHLSIPKTRFNQWCQIAKELGGVYSTGKFEIELEKAND